MLLGRTQKIVLIKYICYNPTLQTSPPNFYLNLFSRVPAEISGIGVFEILQITNTWTEVDTDN